MSADHLVVESTLGFTKAFTGLPPIEGENKEQVIWLFWNGVDSRERTGVYEAYQSIIRQLNLSIMQSRIIDSKRFRKETDDTGSYVFRSSLLPDLFVDEFLKIVQL